MCNSDILGTYSVKLFWGGTKIFLKIWGGMNFFFSNFGGVRKFISKFGGVPKFFSKLGGVGKLFSYRRKILTPPSAHKKWKTPYRAIIGAQEINPRKWGG
jgi:hypothetical protein